jgi:hypothetical protein
VSITRGWIPLARFNGARKRTLLVALVASVALTAFATAPSAHAGIQHEFAVFSDCPINSPGVTSCIVSTTTSGEFHIGKKTVPISLPVLLQGGLTATSPVLVPAADGNTLSKTALPVPGGIVGIEILGPLTSVTATAELAGPVEINVTNANTGKGTAASFPLKVKLDNPLLLNACYIGSESEPLTPQLTTGTTNPPPPNGPIKGSTGEIVISAHGKILGVKNSSLVDNAFAVPGANGCAGPLALVVDPAVNLQVGLPAAAGQNTAILNGSLEQTTARAVKAQAQLPDLGRCVKAESHKEGKATVFNGGYVDSGCVEENREHTGKFEWVPGPGPLKKFTGTSLAVTLETVGKAKVKCLASHTTGEYTGTKTATLNVTLTECKLAAKNETCQSAGAATGEITANGLGATLGFIKDESKGTELSLSLGWDLAHEPSVLSAECGSAKEALLVTGSVIAPIGTIDKMTSAYPLKFSAVSGKQVPEAFEEAPKDTLSASVGAGSAEQAGLTAANKITNEDKLEFKGETE